MASSAPTRTNHRLLGVVAATFAGFGLALALADDARADTGDQPTPIRDTIARLLTPARQAAPPPADRPAKTRPRPIREATRHTAAAVGGGVEHAADTIKRIKGPADAPGSGPADEPTSPPSTAPSRDGGPQTAPEPATADNPRDRAGSGAHHPAKHPAATRTRTGPAAPATTRHHNTTTVTDPDTPGSPHPTQDATPCTGGTPGDTINSGSQPYATVATWQPQPTTRLPIAGRHHPHLGRTFPPAPPSG